VYLHEYVDIVENHKVQGKVRRTTLGTLGRRDQLAPEKIDGLIERGYIIDGIELYNPSPANAAARAAVRQLNQQWNFAGVGSSDAHFWQHIGAGYTLFPGNNAADVRQAILQHTTRDGGQEQPPERLPLTSYIGQCFWSMVIDPPRKFSRMARGERAEAPTSAAYPNTEATPTRS